MIYSGAANGEVTSSNKTGTTTQIGEKNYIYNSAYNDNTYVGYMNGNSEASTYEDAHQNKSNSKAKIEIDDWYKINIVDNNYENYIDTETGFCNDRETIGGTNSIYGTLGYGKNATSYAAWARLYQNKNWKATQTPTLICANKKRDLFTYTSASEGNKKLTYPVGMITSDEVIFAGGFGEEINNSYYLYTSNNYWTISPCFVSNYKDASSVMLIVHKNGDLNWVDVFWNESGLRPVINLRADTKFIGTGSETDPFVVI